MTNEEASAQIDEQIAIAVLTANPEHSEVGGADRQSKPVPSAAALRWVSLEPVRSDPKWAAFVARVVTEGSNGKFVRIQVPWLRSLRQVLTPVKGKKGLIDG